MAMTTLICLANSWKHQGRCLAGIHPETGQWIRPVSDLEDGRIPQRVGSIQVKEIKLLEVWEIPLAETGPDFGFASENRRILPGTWRKLGTVTVEAMLPYCETETEILHNTRAYVTIPQLQALPFQQRRTLQLVETQQFTTTVARVRQQGGHQWKGDLVTTGGRRLQGRITDPELVKRLDWGYEPSHHCLVTVSLGMPWVPPNWQGDAPCWKLIAGVMDGG